MIHKVLEWLDESTPINKPVSAWKMIVAQTALALTMLGMVAMYLFVMSLPVLIGLLIGRYLGVI
jgi:hypothetical protein